MCNDIYLMIDKDSFRNELLKFDYFLCNEYFDYYVDLIVSNEQTEKSNITQSHHILPKHYFIHNNINIDNSEKNLVNLIYSDHIKAHYFLSLCTKNEKDILSNEASLIRMIGKKSISDFDFCRYNELYENYQNYNRDAHIGTHHSTSEKTKEKISNSLKGKYKGNICIFNGDIEKHIKPCELDMYIESGWSVGRPQSVRNHLSESFNRVGSGMSGKKQSDYQKTSVSNALTGVPKSEEARVHMKEARVGKILVSNNDTKESFYISPNELNNYVCVGFHRGRLNK